MADSQDYRNGGERSPSPRREQRDERSRSPERRPAQSEGQTQGDDRGRPANNAGDKNPGNNLHVSGLSTRVEDRDLEEVFSKFGRVQKCQVVRDPHTKDSRGFAFVTMETSEEADQAIAGLNATELMGRTMNVERARRARARTPTPGQYQGPQRERRGYEPRGYERGGYGGGGYGGGYGGGSRYDPYGAPPPPRGYDDRRGGYDRSYPPPPPPQYAGYGGSYRDDRGAAAAYPPPPMRGYDDRDYRGGGGSRYEDRGAPRRDDRYRY